MIDRDLEVGDVFFRSYRGLYEDISIQWVVTKRDKDRVYWKEEISEVAGSSSLAELQSVGCLYTCVWEL